MLADTLYDKNAIKQLGETEYNLHPQAADNKGGFAMIDKGGLMIGGMKELFKKVGNKVVKGEFTDLMKTPCPSYMHVPVTLLDLMMSDFSFARKYLLAAAKEEDPYERIKHVIAFFVAPNYINPSLT